MKPSTLARTTEIISAFFILLFVYTATSKLLSHQTFVINLKKSPLIAFASGFLSWAIPSIEIIIAVLLFFPRFRRLGLLASFGLMTVFTIYIAYMLLTSSHLPCSCGGVISKLSWKEHLWLNVLFSVLAAFSLCLQQRFKFLLQ